MLDVLQEAGYVPDLSVGCSFGALNAAAAAVPGTGQVADLSDMWHAIAGDSPFSSPTQAIVRQLGRRTAKSTAEWRETIAVGVPAAHFDELTHPVHVVASDLEAGETTMLHGGSLPAALAAATAMPLILPPVEHDKRLLVDGSFTEGMPVHRALALGARSIVVLDVGGTTVPEPEVGDLRWWQVGATAYSHLVRAQVGPDVTESASQVPIVVLSTDAGNILDFSDPEAMFDAGRVAAGAIASLADTEEAGLYGIPVGFEEYPPFEPLVRQHLKPAAMPSSPQVE